MMTVGYFVFINNTERIVKDLVSYYTDGKLKMELKRLDFSLREFRITIVDAKIYNVDTIHQSTTYDIAVDTMLLELASVRPLLFNRKIEIDSITFKRPSIAVTQWKEVKKAKFTLPQQMEKVYTSLNKTLDKLSIKYCLLDSGAFSIEDKVHTDRKKVVVTDFYFLIDNLNKQDNLNRDDRFFFSDRIKFYSSHQHIILASGNQEIGYSRLRINSRRKIIELDSCFVYSKKQNSDFNEFSAYFDTLKFTGVDFNRLTQENVLDADSAYCSNPKILLKTTVRNNTKTARVIGKDSFAIVMKSLLGNFNLNHIGVDNAGIEIQTKSGNKISSYNIKRTDFSMQDVAVIDHPDSSIKVGSFDLGLVGYQAYDPDSNYQVKFDSIHFADDKIFLSHFTITPSKKIQSDDFKDIRMSSLAINQISWIDLLVNRKIVADEIALISPALKLVLPETTDEKERNKKLHFLSAFKKIATYADVNKLLIKNAMLNIRKGDLLLDLKDLNCSIPVNRLLQSEKMNDLLSASVFVGFESGKVSFNQNEIFLKKGHYDGDSRLLFLKETFAGNNANSLNGYFQNLTIREPVESSAGHFNFSAVSWDKANITLNVKENAVKKPGKKPIISISECNGSNTRLQINVKGLNANGNLSSFTAKDFVSDENGKLNFSDLSFKGKNIAVSKNALHIDLSEIDCKDRKPSTISGFILKPGEGKKLAALNFPFLDFSVDLNKVIRNEFDFEYIDIRQPIINIRDNENVDVAKNEKKIKALPEIKIATISISEPVIHAKEFEDVFKPGNGNLHASVLLNDDELRKNSLICKSGNISTQDLLFTNQKFTLNVPADEALKLSLHDFIFNMDEGSQNNEWSFWVDTIQSGNLKLDLKNNTYNKKEIRLGNTVMSAIHVSNANIRHPELLLNESPHFTLHNKSIGYSDDKTLLSFTDLAYKNEVGKLTLDNFRFRPAAGREEFVAMNEYQKDYPLFSTESIIFSGVSLNKYFKDSVLTADKMELVHPDLFIYKDKRKPFKKGVYKHLPGSGLKQLKMKFDIDSVIVSNGDITYEELNEKTGKSGKVVFSDLKASITTVKNFNHSSTDSLRLVANAKFMDSASMRFRFSESFADSLHAFTYGLRFRPFDLKVLNPILEPLVSARILSGGLDTLRVNAIGREHMSHGKMKMYYNGLKIQYLNKGSDSVKNIRSRLINFVANDLLLKRNNKKGVGIVYTERDKERGFANYWLKIGLSGVVSSSGVKKNKKIEKRYRRQLKKMKVPDIPEVDM